MPAGSGSIGMGAMAAVLAGVWLEGAAELPLAVVEQDPWVGGRLVEPVLVGGDGDAEDRVRDRLRREFLGPAAGALGDELGDHLAPGGEPQRRVREQRAYPQD